MKELTLELLAKAISQYDSALRLRLKLEPVGGAIKISRGKSTLSFAPSGFGC